MNRSKTFKREYAFIFVLILTYEIYIGNLEMVKVIIWPMLSFVAASAGLHIYGESTKTTRATTTDSYPSP